VKVAIKTDGDFVDVILLYILACCSNESRVAAVWCRQQRGRSSRVRTLSVLPYNGPFYELGKTKLHKISVCFSTFNTLKTPGRTVVALRIPARKRGYIPPE
jgi:hypothetical protein